MPYIYEGTRFKKFAPGAEEAGYRRLEITRKRKKCNV